VDSRGGMGYRQREIVFNRYLQSIFGSRTRSTSVDTIRCVELKEYCTVENSAWTAELAPRRTKQRRRRLRGKRALGPWLTRIPLVGQCVRPRDYLEIVRKTTVLGNSCQGGSKFLLVIGRRRHTTLRMLTLTFGLIGLGGVCSGS